MDSQADKTVARSISHLSLRYTATTTISLFFRFSIAPFITAILVVRARHSRHTRGARRQSRAPAGSRHHFESECHEQRRLEVAGNRGRLCLCRRARPLVPCLSLCLIYMASSVPVPSRDESSPLPEPPRADEAVCNSPLALESSPAPPLEAIDPARLFVNREGGSPPRPRLLYTISVGSLWDILDVRSRETIGENTERSRRRRRSRRRCCPSPLHPG